MILRLLSLMKFNGGTDMYNMICSVLDDMGYVVLEAGEDFNISDYIVDSIQFISFIVNIEKKLNVSLSDDFLLPEILKSAKGFANKLAEYCK